MSDAYEIITSEINNAVNAVVNSSADHGYARAVGALEAIISCVYLTADGSGNKDITNQITRMIEALKDRHATS